MSTPFVRRNLKTQAFPLTHQNDYHQETLAMMQRIESLHAEAWEGSLANFKILNKIIICCSNAIPRFPEDTKMQVHIKAHICVIVTRFIINNR